MPLNEPGACIGADVNYYTFTAIQTEQPHSEWSFVAGINEKSFTATLSSLCDDRVMLDRIDTYLLATCIIHQKAKSLLMARMASAHFHFAPFKALDAKPQFGTPDYQAGGLFIWFMNPPVIPSPSPARL